MLNELEDTINLIKNVQVHACHEGGMTFLSSNVFEHHHVFMPLLPSFYVDAVTVPLPVYQHQD